ncbi:MAG: hypothetical protein JO227_12550 [Acetobacteraceae bacterium]|nr:hypothetical protein [Acetobacteraceae bacterium]
MKDDRRAGFQLFQVDPSWYREYWFDEGKPALSRRKLTATGGRPIYLPGAFRAVTSALSAAVATLRAGSSRQAAERS